MGSILYKDKDIIYNIQGDYLNWASPENVFRLVSPNPPPKKKKKKKIAHHPSSQKSPIGPKKAQNDPNIFWIKYFEDRKRYKW